ncbi:MAG: hypothetical protein JOZ32_01680 [Bryobacterales bacterium]|nr:hypothetical protein [Bryobacterales bacterium]
MKNEAAGKPQASGRFGLTPVGTPARHDVRREIDAALSRSDLEIYGWRIRDQPVSIHMQVAVLDRLQQEIVSGLNMSAPCDIAGILMGRVATETGLAVMVEDYKTSRYTGDAGDCAYDINGRIADTIAEWGRRNEASRVLGFFRSQRRGRPIIDSQDLKSAERLFPRAQNIFLLIGSAVDGQFTGAFYFRQAGASEVEKEYGEFPFDADILRARSLAQGIKLEEPTQRVITARQWVQQLAVTNIPHTESIIPVDIVRPAPPEPVQGPVLVRPESNGAAPSAPIAPEKPEPAKIHEPPLLEEPAPDESPEVLTGEVQTGLNAPANLLESSFDNPPSQPARSWPSWLSMAAVWTIAVGATMWCMDGRNIVNAGGPSATELRPIAMTNPLAISDPAALSNPLGLAVDRSGGLLEIGWDRNSGTARNSDGGFMTIRDGGLLKQVSLDSSEIRTGHIYYEPRSTDLGIRLEVASQAAGATSESIRVMGAPR